MLAFVLATLHFTPCQNPGDVLLHLAFLTDLRDDIGILDLTDLIVLIAGGQEVSRAESQL